MADRVGAAFQSVNGPAGSAGEPLPVGVCVAVWVAASLALWALLFSPFLW
jgi:hypothetical protein